ncbi:MAG: adenosylhomocysteinase [Oscillospiraceae bacterium]|nr:adenosylhomocysteinase [Oscillospiraceae bacterium]
MLQSNIDDPTLAQAGALRIKWYREKMDVLRIFRERYERERPFRGKTFLVCMHCEPKAAVRTEVLLAGGAEKIVFVGNLGSTKPDTAAYLSALPNVTVLAKKGDTLRDLEASVAQAMREPYDLLMDNGASLLQRYWSCRGAWRPQGAIEETRSGRLILEKQGISPDFPVLVIDDSPVKRLVENETGVGQSVVDGFMRATSMLIGGKKILIIGYGFCGLGIAQRFRALGACTMVYDTDPLRLLKAKIEGHAVGRLDELLPQADVVLTVTGRFDVVGEREIRLMKDGAVLCNAGHYNMEIDVARLREIAPSPQTVQDGIEKYTLGEKTLYLLQNANPINLASGAGNPLEIMELGYALQLLSLERIAAGGLPAGAQPLPDDVNSEACRICLWGARDA